MKTVCLAISSTILLLSAGSVGAVSCEEMITEYVTKCAGITSQTNLSDVPNETINECKDKAHVRYANCRNLDGVAGDFSGGKSKPEGGACECNTYMQTPEICSNSGDAKACRERNQQWIDRCQTWANANC